MKQELLTYFKDSNGYRSKVMVKFLEQPHSIKGFPLFNYFWGIGLEKITLPKANIGDTFKVRVKASLINPQVKEYGKYLEFWFDPIQCATWRNECDGLSKAYCTLW